MTLVTDQQFARSELARAARARAEATLARLLRTFDEGKHPREPAGSPHGGEFASGGGGAGDTAEKPAADEAAKRESWNGKGPAVFELRAAHADWGDKGPLYVESHAQADTKELADELVTHFPKSTKIYAGRVGKSGGFVRFRADLAPNKTTGEINETGLKRYKAFLKAVDTKGHTLRFDNSNQSASQIYASLDELHDAIGVPKLKQPKSVATEFLWPAIRDEPQRAVTSDQPLKNGSPSGPCHIVSHGPRGYIPRGQGFDPSQPRDEHGRWTDGGGSDPAGGQGEGSGRAESGPAPAPAAGVAAARLSGAYGRQSPPDDGRGGRGVTDRWELDAQAKADAVKLHITPQAYDEYSAAGASAFHGAIIAGKADSKYGAAVHAYPEDDYKGMRLFLTEDGKSGFALKDGDDIVSAFKNSATKGKGYVTSTLALATQHGGRRLDAFDTVLPKFYGDAGFRAVARLAWNDEYKPDDWDYETFKEFNAGRPDVVFMVYDPTNAREYQKGDGVRVASYDEGTAAQKAALREIAARTKAVTMDSTAITARLITTEYLWPAAKARAEKTLARLRREFDEGKHPREPAGSPSGGQFTSGDGGGGDSGQAATPKSSKDVHALKPDFAKIAQAEYDAWTQDAEGVDEELGTGGICDRIASGMADKLGEHGIETAEGGQPGDEHAWVIANLSDGVYAIDIPPHVYETGGGYNWKKKPGVKITADDVSIDKIDGPISDEEFAKRYQERSFNSVRPSKTWDEGKHPRDPAGTSTGGQFTSGGGGEASAAGDAKVEVEPHVVDVGGDQWNRDTALRLETEFQTVRPKLEEIEKQAVGETQTTATSDDADEEDPTNYVPEEWDSMAAVDQHMAEKAYMEQTYDDYFNNEEEYWKNEYAPDEARVKVAVDYNDKTETEWATDVLDDIRAEREAEGKSPIPYTNAQLLDAIRIDYEGSGGGSTNDPEIEFDDDALKEPQGYDPAQQILPGIEEIAPSAALSVQMRDEIEKRLTKAFGKQADSVADDLPTPDYISDQAKEMQGESWDSMSDSDKFSWVENNTSILKDLEEAYGVTTTVGGNATLDRLPDEYDPLNETSGDDYRRTQFLARYISRERAAQVLEARNLPVPPRFDLQNIDNELWRAWKESSTSKEGKLLQLATAEELGGRMNKKTSQEIDPEATRAFADRIYTEIGGYAGVKAYVRAKWETTQYLLDKADHDELQLYRGVSLDPGLVEKLFTWLAKHAANGARIDGMLYIPTMDVLRNGAASTSVSQSVANGWSAGSPGKVTLRALIPRTAAISIPAYGINVKSEQEVVVAGTAWKGWDAWKGPAPSFDRVAMHSAQKIEAMQAAQAAA